MLISREPRIVEMCSFSERIFCQEDFSSVSFEDDLSLTFFYSFTFLLGLCSRSFFGSFNLFYPFLITPIEIYRIRFFSHFFFWLLEPIYSQCMFLIEILAYRFTNKCGF